MVRCVTPEYPEHGKYLVNGKLLNPGTVVEPFTFLYYLCDDNYVVNDATNVYCDGGKWTKKVRCVGKVFIYILNKLQPKIIFKTIFLDCGRYPSDGSPGTPWTVGIYKKRGTQFRYNCGGTILSDRVVISGQLIFLFVYFY